VYDVIVEADVDAEGGECLVLDHSGLNQGIRKACKDLMMIARLCQRECFLVKLRMPPIVAHDEKFQKCVPEEFESAPQ